MKTLPKLSEYVLKETKEFFENRDYEPSDLAFNLQRITNFLTQPLTLSHFVPAIEKDGKWIVLEEPKDFFDFMPEYQEYQTALDNVVFKGCKIVEDRYKETKREIIYLPNTQKQVWRRLTFHNGKVEEFFFTYYKEFTDIESIIPYNLDIKESVAQELGLI